MDFNEIIEKYSNKIMKLCYLHLGSIEEAEDATQEVLLKVYKNIGTFKGDSNVYTWVYKVTINHCYNKIKRRNRFSFEDISNYLSLKSEDSVEDEVLCDFEIERLRAALFKVDEKYRIPLYLYYYDSMKVKEIAVLLEQSENTVKTKLRRGKELLKVLLIEKESV